jgi:PAS domain-containing protein
MVAQKTDQLQANKVSGPYNQLSTKLFDNLPIAVYTCDTQGYITSFNHAAVQLWGRTPEIGKDLWCGSWKIFRLNGEPLTLDGCPMARTLKEGIAIEGEEIIIERPDGTRLNVLPYPVPAFNDAGELIGAINTLVDVTEQRSSETKQAMLAAIIESSEDAIISKTLKGIITTWNKSAEKMFGYSEQEMAGKSIIQLIPKTRRQEEDVILQRSRFH